MTLWTYTTLTGAAHQQPEIPRGTVQASDRQPWFAPGAALASVIVVQRQHCVRVGERLQNDSVPHGATQSEGGQKP